MDDVVAWPQAIVRRVVVDDGHVRAGGRVDERLQVAVAARRGRCGRRLGQTDRSRPGELRQCRGIRDMHGLRTRGSLSAEVVAAGAALDPEVLAAREGSRREYGC